MLDIRVVEYVESAIMRVENIVRFNMKEAKFTGLRLAETMMMAELFGKSDKEIIEEARALSERSLREPIHITDLKATHRYYCLTKELNRRGYNVPAFDFEEDLEISIKGKAEGRF